MMVACGDSSDVVIRDYVVGFPYEVVSVDGNPPKRQEHGLIVSYVPFVLVSEGNGGVKSFLVCTVLYMYSFLNVILQYS